MRQSLAILGMLTSAAALVAAAPAEAEAPIYHQLDVPEQSMSAALRQFSRQSGQPVLFSEDVVSGLRSRAVRGKFTNSQALQRMIDGSQLIVRRTPDGVLLFSREQPAAPRPIAYQAVPAHAIEQPTPTPAAEAGPNGGVLTDIVVTAQRREQRLQDVPVAVSVTSGEALTKNNIVSITDLAARSPSFRVTQAPASAQLYIRGVGSGINGGFEQAVGTFVDGLYRGRSRAISAALFDVERVEILKGPQTTYFGNNVIAGALNVVTRKPSDRRELNGSALYSPSDGEYSLEAGVSLPVSDSLSFRVAGKAFGMNGYAFNERTQDDVPRQRDWTLRASVRWEPSATWRTDLRVDRTRLRDRGSPVSELENCPPDSAYGLPRGSCLRYINSGLPVDDDLNYRVSNISAHVFYDLVEAELTNTIDVAGGTLTTITGYFNHDDDTLADSTAMPVGGVPAGTAVAQSVNTVEDAEQYSQELRFASPEDRDVAFMFGGYAARENLNTSLYSANYFGPFGQNAAPIYNADTPIAAVYGLRQRTTTLSAFGSLTVKLAESLKLDLGLRFTSVHKKADRTLIYGTGGAILTSDTFVPGPDSVQAPLIAALGGTAAPFPHPTRTDRRLMPSVKVRYNLTPDVMAYASYTSGFKAGGYGLARGAFEFAPETVDAYELGAKATLLDRRLFASLAVFRSDYADLQESTQITVPPNFTIVTVLKNAATARAQGVELGLILKVSPWLSFNADMAYLDAKYINYPGAPCTSLAALTPNCQQDMSGKRRAFSPRFSGNVGFSASFPITDTLEARFDPTMYFTSRYFQSATADPLLSQSGFAKVDARLGFGPSDRSWEVAVIAKNLTDKKTAAFRNNVAGSPGTIWLYPERPRSVAFQASIKY